MIDKEIVTKARGADMIAFLNRHCGYTFTQKRGAYRCKQHPSLAVKNDRRSWYWHSKSIGGYGAIDYLMKIDQLLFSEAVEAAKSSIGAAAPLPTHTAPGAPGQPKTLVLPQKTGIPIRLYDYLCVRRGIHSDVVNTLIQRNTLYEDRRGNVVFVGYDGHGKPRFASVRGTYGNCSFRADCVGSDKRYGFNMAADAPSDSVYVFESPIDAMSHASLAIAEFGDRTAWEYDRRLSLAGTSDTALPFFLNKHTSVKELVFCLDNDPAGREASEALARKYAEKGLRTRIQLPVRKDFNEELLEMAKMAHPKKAQQRDICI